MKIYDPYDIWSLPVLGSLKSKWSSGHKLSGMIIPFIGIVEVLAPITFRKVIGCPPHDFPHVEAMRYLAGQITTDNALRLFAENMALNGGWGLPFSWYSKNGIYPANTAYVTNTPYVMMALLSIASEAGHKKTAMDLFEQSREFLDALEVMHDTPTELALSYAPVEEPRKVVNANSYAALAYTLHAKYGELTHRKEAIKRVTRLINWILSQQNQDGSWPYYADDEPGNFIDCFHSCFVVKNLIKVQQELPELADQIAPAAKAGWDYIRSHLFDPEYRLCRRFSKRSHRDPFRWDLYDQAEYLGLLVDFGLYDEAYEFAEHVQSRFSKNEHWYCRIDILGRRWGKNFMRWGIAPFLYHQHRLLKATEDSA